MAKARLRREAAKHLERLGQTGLGDLLVEELGVGRLIAHGGGKGGKSLMKEGENSSSVCRRPGGRGWNCQASLHSNQHGHQIDKTTNSAEHCPTPARKAFTSGLSFFDNGEAIKSK